MPKRDPVRRIDTVRTYSGNGSGPALPTSSSGWPADLAAALEVVNGYLHARQGQYAGLLDAAHVALREDDPAQPDKAWLEATDHSNLPFFTMGARTATSGDVTWRLGYEGQPGIALVDVPGQAYKQVRIDPGVLEGAAGGLLYSYIIHTDGVTTAAVNGQTGVTDYSGADAATVIQQAITAAGVGGSLAFRPGVYWLGTALVPASRQTWWCQAGAVFRPSGNNRIIHATGTQWWQVYGTLQIQDTDRHTSSVEAILLDGIIGCYFQHILIWDYWNGLTLQGQVGRAYENIFVDVYAAVIRNQGFGIWGEVGDNEFHSVFLKGPSTTEWASAQGLVIGLFPVYGTVFGGLMFQRVEVLDFNVNVDLQGLYEVWIGQLLSDNAYWAALYIGDQVQRLFLGTVWAAGSGDGIWLVGSAANPVRAVMIDKAFVWINAQYGVALRGHVEDVQIGALYLLENQVGQLVFQGGANNNVTIGSVYIRDTPVTGLALDAGGAGANVVIHEANIEGATAGLDALRAIDGVRQDVGLFRNAGRATIASGASSVVVTHGLERQPVYIGLTPYHAETAGAYVAAQDSTTFTLATLAPVSASREISWTAQSGTVVGAELVANAEVDFGTTWPDYWTHSASGVAWASGAGYYRTSPHALRLNPGAGLGWWLSEAFAVSAGSKYRVQGYLRGLGNAYTFLALTWYSDAGGTVAVAEDAVSLNRDFGTSFMLARSEFVAPAGAVTARLGLKNTADLSTDVYGDDFGLAEAGEANLLANPSVESGSGTPASWTLSGQATWPDVGRTGSKSVRLLPTASAGEAAAAYVPVIGGTIYTASAWLQGPASGNVTLGVRWYSDAGGLNLIGESSAAVVGSYATWTEVAAAFTAPFGAQSAVFVYRAGGVGAVDVYGDSFSVYELTE